MSKLDLLKDYFSGLERVIVAFSGGVDSSFLVKVAHDVLGEKVLAVTARSLSYPGRELREAEDFCREYEIRHMVIDSEELDIEGFEHNPVNRCYLCKGELFSKLEEVARKMGVEVIMEGSNADDVGDYRPGLQAVAEHGIRSPLKELGFTKEEIRKFSKELGLRTWDKQAFACLSSRFPYGDEITPAKLQMIDQAEDFLLDMGFKHIRVRCHGNLARIETNAEGMDKMIDKRIRELIHHELKKIGFTYISLDLIGYRTGSMNEPLNLS